MAYAASTFSISVSVTASSSSEFFTVKATFSNPNLSVLRHKVTWSAGEHTYTSDYTAVGAKSASYQIPVKWYDAAPDSETMTVTVKVSTYSGTTKQGSTATKTTQVGVPFQLQPSAPTIGITILHGIPRFSGKIIFGINGIDVSLSNVVPASGTTIVSYSLEIYKQMSQQGSVYEMTFWRGTQATNLFEFDPFQFGVDEFYLKGYVTDSRGRTSIPTRQPITICDYYEPRISSVTAQRCLADGTINENGTYATIKCVTSHTAYITTGSAATAVSNPITINSFYYPALHPEQRSTLQLNMVSGTEYLVGNGSFDRDTTYIFEFEAEDAVGLSATDTIVLNTVPYSIHVKNGGHGVAFGKASEITDAVEINDSWDLYYKGKKIDIIEVTTPGFAVLPVTFSAPGVTSDYELLQDGFAYVYPRSSVGDDWTITTGTDTITISGTFAGSDLTYVKAVLCDKQKLMATQP